MYMTDKEAKEIASLVYSALEWAAIPLPKDAIISHLGISTFVGDWSVGFGIRDADNAVVMVYLAHGDRYNQFMSRNDFTAFAMQPEEVSLLKQHLPKVRAMWNGAGYKGVSFVVSCIWHPTVLAAQTINYNNCPVGDPSCRAPVFCRCAARERCYAKATRPKGW